MEKVIKITISFLFSLIIFAVPIFAQEDDIIDEQEYVPFEYEPYDPLIPQLFAFDKQLGIFAGINNVENKIVIVSHKGDDTLFIAHEFEVDKVVGRHDTHHIYRPKSVAIYDGLVAFLASHRDGCYFAVLDLNGNLIKRLDFPGFASAFSYSPSANELYISGEHDTGFDVIVLDTSNGISQICEKKDVMRLHYQKPRMSEEIAKRDPYGIGMAMIAMSVVFLALLMLYLVFRQVGVQMLAIQKRRSQKPTEKPSEKKVEPKRESVSSNAAMSDGVYAAIAAAIHLYSEEIHDVENTVLTINKVSRTYSPWNSKIFGLNTFNKR
ncbi:MAG: OadG family protein [Marinilabiliaceae bacterium]|nr:OadG family protein [Marinilabiliaceae bacterium]